MNNFVLAWRNVGRNRRRSLLSITAITVATLSMVILFSLLAGMQGDLRHNLTTFYTGEVELRHRDYGTYEHLNPIHLSVDNANSRVQQIAGITGVQSVVPRVLIGGAIFRDDQRIGLQAVGVDFDQERDYSSIGDYVVAGDFEAVRQGSPTGIEPSRKGRIAPALVGNGVLDRLEIDLGDTFTLVVRTALRSTNAMTFQATAVADFPVESLNQQAFWAPITDVQRLAQMPDQTGSILVKLAPGTAEAETLDALRSSQGDLETRRFTEMETTYSLMEMASAVYSVIGLFFFLLAATVIVNTMMMVIFERRREIGTLEAMGMSRGELVRMFLSESVILSVAGAALGLVIGSTVSIILGRVGIDVGSAMEGVDFEISPVLYPVLNLRSTVGVFIASVLVSGVTSYIPTRRITKIEPVAALREE